MALVTIPTSAQVYLEVDGKRLAAAQSYRVRSSRESRYVEAFGSEEPVGTVGGRVRHQVEFSRVCICDGEVDFYGMQDFSLVIVKPDGQEVFTGCQWSEIVQSAGVDEVILEKVTAVATGRMKM